MKKSNWFFIALVVGSIIFTRLWQLDTLPPSPYEEEVALGYEAFSLWKTGKDHHGNEWPILALQSFGDWKPTLYAYSIIPLLPLLDLSVLAVRLPSALAGVVIVAAIISLAKFFKISQKWTALAAATSPWLIMFSRAAWEANLATAFITSGVAVFLWQTTWKSFRRRLLAVVFSAILLFASAYTYHAARVIAPLLMLGLVGWSLWPIRFSVTLVKQKLSNANVRLALLLAIFTTLGVFPLLWFARQPIISQRAMETSFIATPELVQRAVELHVSPYIVYGQEFVKNYLLHLDPRFLFIDGDINPRHSSQHTALFYWFDAIILATAILWLFRHLSKNTLLLIYWFAIVLIPVSITKDVPHALRILPAAPVGMLLLGIGYQHVSAYLNKIVRYKHSGTVILGVILSVQFVFFWRYYTRVYPVQWSDAWQYGLEEVVTKTNEYLQKNPGGRVYFYYTINRPLMYYWFYNKTNPAEVQAVARDYSGEVQAFNQLHIGEPDVSPVLYVHRGKADAPAGAVLQYTVEYLNGEPAWKLYER